LHATLATELIAEIFFNAFMTIQILITHD